MNQKPIPTPLIVGIVVVAIAVLYVAWPQTPQTPSTETASTSTPAATPVTPTAPSATGPSFSKDSMSTSLAGGVVPFSSSFTLRLNANRSCSPVTYTIDFGDNIKKDVQVPQSQCAKLYTVVEPHQYQRSGVFTATLSTKPVTGQGVVLSKITITAKDPVVTTGTPQKVTLTTSPVAGYTPLTVKFDLSANDGSESAGIYYTIVFGDGQTALFDRTATPTLSHVYTNPGTFVVNVAKKTQCSAGVCTGPSSPISTVTITVQ
jgi:PKD domain